MNSWLGRGLFCMTWVACMWLADFFLANTGKTSYVALMIGAASIALVGLIKQAFTNTRNNQNG